MYKLSSTSQGEMTLKLELAKAYDIAWNFLQQSLLAIGFSKTWTNGMNGHSNLKPCLLVGKNGQECAKEIHYLLVWGHHGDSLRAFKSQAMSGSSGCQKLWNLWGWWGFFYLQTFYCRSLSVLWALKGLLSRWKREWDFILKGSQRSLNVKDEDSRMFSIFTWDVETLPMPYLWTPIDWWQFRR